MKKYYNAISLCKQYLLDICILIGWLANVGLVIPIKRKLKQLDVQFNYYSCHDVPTYVRDK